MSEIFKGVVYLSEGQYREKYNAQTLDVNTLYVTPDNGNSGGGDVTPVDAYTKSETDALLSVKANQVDLDTTNDLVSANTTAINSKADKDKTYTKTEVDGIKASLEEQIGSIQASIPVRNFIEV